MYLFSQFFQDGHVGMVRMKAIAISYVWWPNIEKEIEQLYSSCLGRHQVGHMPKSAPVHPWEWPSVPWQRLHIDFAGLNVMFLVVPGAHSNTRGISHEMNYYHAYHRLASRFVRSLWYSAAAPLYICIYRIMFITLNNVITVTPG